MIARKHGRILQTSSINGKIGSLLGAAYAAGMTGQALNIDGGVLMTG